MTARTIQRSSRASPGLLEVPVDRDRSVPADPAAIGCAQVAIYRDVLGS